MPADKTTITPVMHRQLGVDLFNKTWTLIEKTDRTPDEVEIMIHTAHASAYHWRQVGTHLNFCRSDWQLSRVYAVLNRLEPALYHARRCLDRCEAEGIGDFDLAFAYEALARSYHAGDQKEEAQKYLVLAHQAGKNIKKKGDRDYFFDELATIPSGGE